MRTRITSLLFSWFIVSSKDRKLSNFKEKKRTKEEWGSQKHIDSKRTVLIPGSWNKSQELCSQHMNCLVYHFLSSIFLTKKRIVNKTNQSYLHFPFWPWTLWKNSHTLMHLLLKWFFFFHTSYYYQSFFWQRKCSHILFLFLFSLIFSLLWCHCLILHFSKQWTLLDNLRQFFYILV